MPYMEEDQGLPPNREEELLIDALKASPIGIAVEDMEGRPLFANPALCSMLGFSEEEMRNKHCVEFSPPEDAQKDWALFEKLRAGSIDHYQLEKHFFRRDGSLIRGRLSISLLGSGASRRVVAMVENLSEITASRNELLEQGENAEKVGGRLLQKQEDERARIARELCSYIDNLVVLSLDLDRYRRKLPESAIQDREKIEEIREQVMGVVRDMQGLSQRLRPSGLEYLGLAAACGTFCKKLSDSQKIHVDFRCEGIPDNLPKEIALCLYRVLQESLQNAIQHSRSGIFDVSLSGKSNQIRLRVRDWGIGFDPTAAMKAKGLGLAAMEERVKLFDGDLSIESQPHCGTTICVRVPLPQR